MLKNKIKLLSILFYINDKYYVHRYADYGVSKVPILEEVKYTALSKCFGLTEDEISKITAYFGRTIAPCNDPLIYRRDIDNGDGLKLLNLYELPRHPQGEYVVNSEGGVNWPNILNFILHIAPNERPYPTSRYTYFQLLLDYLAIAWRMPTQKLPILVLGSKQRSTGKTTFLNMLAQIFQSNAHFASVSELESQFNNGWGLANFVLIDEAKIPDKLLVKIRAEATSKSRNINAKFQAAYTIPNYTKFVMATNDVNNFARIEDEENRYFVININPLPDGTEIAEFQEIIENELPHFIEYLAHHHVFFTNKETRIWFNYKDLKTPALQAVVNNAKSKTHMLIEEVLEELYETVSVDKPDDFNIEFSLSQLSKKVGLDKGKEREIKVALKNLGVQVSERKQRFWCIFKGDKTNSFRYSINVGDLGKNWESYEPQAPITLRKLNEHFSSQRQN